MRLAQQVVAIDTGDAKAVAEKPQRNIEHLEQKLIEATGTAKGPVAVNDLAVNPASGNIYLSVSMGESKAPGIVKIDGKGRIEPS